MSSFVRGRTVNSERLGAGKELKKLVDNTVKACFLSR